MKKVLIAAVMAVVAASFAVAEADKAAAKADKPAVAQKAAKAEVKCIVCDKVVEKAVEVKAGDKTLCACCDACAEKVKANPEEFVKKAAEASKDKAPAPEKK